jgi:hypothetical protein
VRRLRLVVLGDMGGRPYGGQTWMFLNWLAGFRALGHDVWYAEDHQWWPYDPDRNAVTDDHAYAVAHVARAAAHVGLGDRWAVRFPPRVDAAWGLTSSALDALYRDCDAIFNVSGSTDLREEHLRAPLRVYIQTDPVTAELRLANGDEHTRWAFGVHHVMATYGENFGAADCGVPLNGITYRPTRQPVDLTLWPMTYDHHARYFTTVGNYRQTGKDVTYGGSTYSWSKHHEWEKIIDLPRRTAQPFELALMADAADQQHLERHGWKIVSPFRFSLDVFGTYPAYIQRSRGEITVAKDQNVRLRSGWFSERDACYLAAGKPVVAQDTGFVNVLPTGEGLFAFRTVDQAAAAIEVINGDYARHAKAARAVAEEFFDAARVARRLLETIGLA